MKRFNYRTPHTGFTLVEIMIVIGVIGIIVAMALPGIIKARVRSRAKACQENQVKLNWAVSEWALTNNSADVPTWVDLVGPGLYMNRTPRCPTSGDAITMPPRLDADTACPGNEPLHSVSATP
jgi:prepilin-type N-terminal cleavage/methylation domain-containing protein